MIPWGGVSIIIPIYNGEKYIKRCLQSVLDQTYPNYEVLLIDDGSTDGSASLCDQYAEKDERIIAFHKENGGVSSARNKGLEMASKDYVAFVDVDDLMDRRYLEVLLKDAVDFQADIVCCGVHEILDNYDGKDTGRLRKVTDNRIVNSIDEYYNDYFKEYSDDWFYGRTVWGCIIQMNLARRETFSDLSFSEDTEYMMKLFSHSPRTFLDSYQGYYYIRWESSATNRTPTLDIKRKENDVALYKTILNLCNVHGNEELIGKACQRYALGVYVVLSSYIKHDDYLLYRSSDEKIENLIDEVKGSKISPKFKFVFNLYSLSKLAYWVIFGVLISVKEKLA